MDHSDAPSFSVEPRDTYFALARRLPPEAIAAQVAAVVCHPVVEAMLQAFCGHVLVLNRERQILAASPEFREALAACGMNDVVGKRPGEALGCEHATEAPVLWEPGLRGMLDWHAPTEPAAKR
jgi:hypothetical protein